MLKTKARILFLDAATVDLGDIDFAALRRQGQLVLLDKRAGDPLPAEAKSARIIISNKYRLGREELSQLSGLNLIAVAATGTNNVDLAEARRRGIAVCNVAGYSRDTVVEHAVMFLLAFAHRFPEHLRAAKDGRWSASPHFALLDFPFSDLAGKRLGILGYGDIGKRVAKVAKALGMEVSSGRLPGRKYSKADRREPLKRLLQRSDYISLHCPLTAETQSLIDAEKLSWMKPSAYLLNLARGPIVDEAALAAALRAGRLAGYGADVTAQEPIPPSSPLLVPELADKVLLTPHVAWASRESRQRLVDEIAANIAAFRIGKKRNRVE
jgi:glycerate dehydrogenase